MWSIIRTFKGEEEIVFTNTLPLCNRKLAQLKASKLKGATFTMKKSGSTIPYEKIHHHRSH